MNNDLILLIPKKNFKVSPNQAKKVMNATANITPGNAYPDIEKKLKQSKILLCETLFPKFVKKENNIKNILEVTTNNNVLRFRELDCPVCHLGCWEDKT